MRSYFPMQEEKDNRVYGALDAGLRGGLFRSVEPRWVEWMKFFLGFMPLPENSAARSMAVLANVVPSNEIKNGLSFQMIDEVRHGTQQNQQEVVHGELYRPLRLRHHVEGVRSLLRDDHRTAVRRGVPHR